MGTFLKVIDALILLFLLKNVVISFLVEEPTCRWGSKWIEHLDNPLLVASYELMWPNIDPLFVTLPVWFQIAVCIHFYCFVPLYSVLFVSIIAGWTRLTSIVGSFTAGMLTYAMGYNLAVQFYGEIRTKDPVMWLVYNVDYLIFAIIIFCRFSIYTPPAITTNAKTKRH